MHRVLNLLAKLPERERERVRQALADGIRTHELLHGKQGLCFLFGADIPCTGIGAPNGHPAE
jgi:hypothetical protein